MGQNAGYGGAAPGAPTPPSIRRADLRFVLPEHPATALARDAGWRSALDLADIGEPQGGRPPDLAVGSTSDAGALVELEAPMILLEGPGSTHPLRSAGYQVASYVLLPDASRPELVLPSAHPAATAYALRRRMAGARGAKRALAPLLDRALPRAHRVVRPAARAILASRVGLRPRVLSDAEALGVPGDAAWCLLLGRHDHLAVRRMAFLAFAPGSSQPSWAVKVARLAGHDDSFERDQRGVDQLLAAAPACAHRAPRTLGQGASGPYQLSVETAAVGDRLTELLRRGGRRQLPLARVVASWLIELAVTSRSDHQRLGPELERIRADVLPYWADAVDGSPLIDALASTPAVLVHGDVGTWNMVGSGLDFSVIDWESARFGPPLWDLLHFLADAATHMAGTSGRRSEFLVRLFKGEEQLSRFVFEYVRELADRLGLSADEVGALATLCWLHYSAPAVSGLHPDTDWYTMRLARRWLEDPTLGPTWSAWQ